MRIKAQDGDPMQHALRILGLDLPDPLHPRYQEEDYHLAGRLPLVDHMARSPFYLHHWADDTSIKLQQGAAQGLFNILGVMTGTLNGRVNPYPPEGAPVFADTKLIDAYIYLCKRHNTSPDNRALIHIRQAGFTESFDRQLGKLVVVLTEASLLIKDAFASLSSEEQQYLSSRPERYFFPEDVVFNFLTAPTHVPRKILPIVHKIDYSRLYTGVLMLSAGIDDFCRYISDSGNRDDYFFDGKKRGGRILAVPSPLGNIIINGRGNNQYNGAGALVIDLGGDDHYTGPVAAGGQVPGRIALLVDAGGNDTYDNGNRRFSQGFGCLSVGMLVDLAGNDHYVAGNMAQGSGMYGVGVLADFQGRDVYRMGMLGQGFGLFGIGLLLDTDDNDRYIMNSLGQGAGSTMGFGSLCDTTGDDKYLADRSKKHGRLLPDEWSHVQGCGISIRSPEWDKHLSFYGGIGFLSDGAGNDLYFASDGNCMGSSYFMSIGALVDHQGSDRYIPQNGMGLGWAVHLSNAVFIDRKGNDDYYSKTRSGGAASDRSVAIFADYDGDDIYGPSHEYARASVVQEVEQRGKALTEKDLTGNIEQKMAEVSYGAAIKPKAIGILIDYGGDDQYYASRKTRNESCGGVVPPVQPQNWSRSMLMDLGGNDSYHQKGRKNHHYFKYMNHGLCYDTEFESETMIGKTPLPPALPHSAFRNSIRTAVKKAALSEELLSLFDGDLFVRSLTKGKIVQRGIDVVPDLVSTLKISPDNEFNRELIEILDLLISSGKLTHRQFKQFDYLLQAQDPFVVIYAAETLSLWKSKAALPELFQVLRHQNDEVRSYVIRAIGRIGAPEYFDSLLSIAVGDPSRTCRREAVVALSGLVQGDGSINSARKSTLSMSLIKCLEDPDESVRTFAAHGLRYFGSDPAVLEALEKRLEDNSVYVRRAAAKSLILNEIKAAIPALIETLKFPSIDTSKHYDHDIPKDLSLYCGIDFPEEERYRYDTWVRWWHENGSGVDLKQNLAIMKNIEMAFAAPNEEEGIAIFESLRSDYPHSIVVRNRYVRYSNDWITFRLLTLEKVDKDIFKRCLRLQKKITELEPYNTGGWVRLGYFNSRLNRYDDAVSAMQVALRIDPGNKSYQKKLHQYQNLLKNQEIGNS